MKLSGKQWFGLIIFIVLIIASYLVTVEPWKNGSGSAETALVPGTPPANLRIEWSEISTGYPASNTTDTICSYSGFDLGYNEAFEQASWVAYILTGDEASSGEVERTDNFRPDTSISTGSSDPSDYRGSGFDRGHLAPAGDMTWSLPAMSESFLMSNMSPQDPSFNRGIWRRLEEQVRRWAVEKDSLYVVTGPVLSSVDSTIGRNEVGIPSHYFKVLVDLSPPDHSFIAFLIPNERAGGSIEEYAITVDSLESYIGYDFFAFAPDKVVVDWLESRIDAGSWPTQP